MTDYRAPTGMPEDWGLYPKSVKPDQRFTFMLRDDDCLLVCEIGGEAKIYPLTDQQIANLTEQFAKRAAHKLRKCISRPT